MYQSNRQSSGPTGGSRGRGDWNKSDSRGSWKSANASSSRGDFAARGPSFDATCGDCGKACKVPFRPNGSRPIFCTNCFKKEGNMPSKNFGGAQSFGKPSFHGSRDDRGSDRGERSFAPPAAAGNTRALEEQLRIVNAKLDAILEKLDA